MINKKSKIIGLIKQYGDFNTIIKKSNLKEAERIILDLLREGEIYEDKPKHLKVL